MLVSFKLHTASDLVSPKNLFLVGFQGLFSICGIATDIPHLCSHKIVALRSFPGPLQLELNCLTKKMSENLLHKHKGFILGPVGCLVEGPSELQEVQSWRQSLSLWPVIQLHCFLKVSERSLKAPLLLFNPCQLWVNLTAYFQHHAVKITHKHLQYANT